MPRQARAALISDACSSAKATPGPYRGLPSTAQTTTPQRDLLVAHLPYVSRLDASPQLATLYDRYSAPNGDLDNIIKIHSLNPPSMEHHVVLYAHLMRGRSPLTREQREMIAVVVSAENDCFY